MSKTVVGLKKRLNFAHCFRIMAFEAVALLLLTENLRALLAVKRLSGCSAVGSASGLGPGGRRFESCHPDSSNWASVFLIDGLGTCFLRTFLVWRFSVIRGVAQLVAHLVWDQGVAGSNPVTPTKISQGFFLERFFVVMYSLFCMALVSEMGSPAKVGGI